MHHGHHGPSPHGGHGTFSTPAPGHPHHGPHFGPHHGPHHGPHFNPPHTGIQVQFGGVPSYSPMPPPVYIPPPTYVSPPTYIPQPTYMQPPVYQQTTYIQQPMYSPQPAYPTMPQPAYAPSYTVTVRPIMTRPLMARPANLMGIMGCYKCQGIGWRNGKPCKRCVRTTHPGVCLFCRGTGWNYKHNVMCHGCHTSGRVYFF